MNEQTELLREIRDLFRLVAEPAIAKRDEKLRTALRELVGKSKQRVKASLLMDGNRSQAAIQKEAGFDKGNLSRFIKELRGAALIGMEDKPKLVIPIPTNFFELSKEK
jgi:hypothetical protein